MKKEEDVLNILVTGALGQLGSSIKRVAQGSGDKYFFSDIDTLDITDEEAVRKFTKDNDIKLIVNCAAFTNVDAAEDRPELAELLNGKAPGLLAQVMKEKEGALFHISTDYVFGGEEVNKPVSEECATNPTGIYGKTKLNGEKEISKTGVSSLIIRTSWLYSEYGTNFVKKIISLLQDRKSIKVVFDQCGTPTYAGDLAEAIVKIISERRFKGNEGIYHFSDEGVCSWYDFAVAIKDLAELKDRKVEPCHSNEFPSKVERPPYSVMDKTKIKATFGLEIPHWYVSLQKCMKNLNQK